jgi:FKBP-type peptidyl-prolyl cis-trans isomerase
MGAHLRIGLLLTAIVCTASIVCAKEEPKPKPKEKAKAKATEAAKSDEQDVPFPKLPEKAGKISEKASKKFTQTKSGLKYRVLREAKGLSPIASDAVEVNYLMWLDDGSEVWNCYEAGETQTFKLKNSLPGLTEGIQLVQEGGLIELQLPGKLAFGDDPPKELKIPINATLHVVVELIDVKGLEYTPDR